MVMLRSKTKNTIRRSNRNHLISTDSGQKQNTERHIQSLGRELIIQGKGVVEKKIGGS